MCLSEIFIEGSTQHHLLEGFNNYKVLLCLEAHHKICTVDIYVYIYIYSPAFIYTEKSQTQ